MAESHPSSATSPNVDSSLQSSSSSSPSFSFLAPLDRWSIVVLSLRVGWTNKRIASLVNCHPDTVIATLCRFHETRDAVDRPRSGRPPLISLDAKNSLNVSAYIKKHRFCSLDDLTRNLRDLTGIQISKSTTRRIAYRLSFHRVSTAKKPLLTQKHREKRLRFAKDNKGEEWDDVIFSDEKMFEFLPVQRIWKHTNEAPVPCCVPQTRHKWMVWGGVWTTGKTDFFMTDDNIDALEYQNSLFMYLIESRHEEYLRLLQDSATPHVAEETVEFLDNFDVELVDGYPPNAPDLNPIERVWGWMVNYVNQHPCSTPSRYEELIHESWRAIPQETIASFISHSPTGIEHILTIKGGN